MRAAAKYLRQRPKTVGFGAISAAATAGVAIGSAQESPADVSALPLVYDHAVIADHWRQRPWASRRRSLELGWCFAPFLARFLVAWRRGELDESAQRRYAAELRQLLEKCGPTFIKLGQALSSRPDLLPPPALRELQRLCDQCPSFDWTLAHRVLAEDLGREPDEVFSGIGDEPRPISAASLGQVYRWVHESRTVAVKVQRPDLREIVSLDMFLLRRLFGTIHTLIVRYTSQRVDHVMLLDAWAAGTWAELDYRAEGANQEEFKRILAEKMPRTVYVPEVIWKCSTGRVLVTEWIDGPKLADADPAIVKSLVPVGIECFSRQLLEMGLFHSDPHAGNLLVRDRQLVLLDFGLVARIERPDMNRLTMATVHLISGNHERLFDDIVALGFLREDADRGAILPVLSGVLDLTVKTGSNMQDRAKNFHMVSNELNRIFFDFPFEVPPYFALITRAILTLEGIGMQLDNSFDIFQAAYPFALAQARRLLLQGDPAASAAMATSALLLAPGSRGDFPQSS